jgi:signal transduction histidine kinase
MSLRWKLMLMAVAVVFIPVWLLNRYAIQYFDRYTRTDFEKNLSHYARIVGEEYKLWLRHGGCGDDGKYRSELREFLDSVGDEIGARICLLDRSGNPVAAEACGGFGREVSFERYPELKEALSGGYSARNRLSPDRRLMYYHIARPIKDADKNMLGVVYIVAHTNPIVQAIIHMVYNQRAATYLALVCAGLVALALALTITRRLRRLTRETRDYAAGRGELGSPPRGGDEIAELGRSIHRMADEIEARNTYNRDFIRTTLHELKTPLTAIQGAVEVLESLDETDGSAADRRRFLEKIGSQSERLTRLVGELRELTRMDVEMPGETREELDYCQFVRDAVERLSETFPDSRAELDVRLPDGELRVKIVPWRMEQVFANLLDNAFRYTSADGRVSITVEKRRDKVVTVVQDSGKGIAASNLRQVFDRFFTTERSQGSPRDYGSGLGLAVVASIIHGHGGDIRVQSEEGKGASFIFEIPV